MVKLLICWLLLSLAKVTFARVIDLKVGEIAEVKLGGQGEIKVNRKNVIVLQPIFKDTWTIYALKKGIVIITLTRFDQTTETTMVRVGFQPVDGPKDKWRRLVCRIPSVSCPETAINGTISSWRIFYQAKQHCLQSPFCDFNLSLSDQAEGALKQYLLDRNLNIDLISKDGFLKVSGHCNQKVQQRLLKKIFSSQVVVNCTQAMVELQVIASVFWLKQDDLDQVGLSPFSEDNLLTGWQWKLTAFLRENQSRIIAYPRMRLTLNSKARVRTGIDTSIPLGQGQITTLKNGVDLSVEAKSLVGDQIKVEVELDVSQSRQSGQRSDRNTIKSELWLTLGRQEIIGSMQTKSNSLEKDQIPILNKIPIIAPLFGSRAKQVSQAQLFLSLMVDNSPQNHSLDEKG